MAAFWKLEIIKVGDTSKDTAGWKWTMWVSGSPLDIAKGVGENENKQLSDGEKWCNADLKTNL